MGDDHIRHGLPGGSRASRYAFRLLPPCCCPSRSHLVLPRLLVHLLPHPSDPYSASCLLRAAACCSVHPPSFRRKPPPAPVPPFAATEADVGELKAATAAAAAAPGTDGQAAQEPEQEQQGAGSASACEAEAEEEEEAPEELVEYEGMLVSAAAAQRRRFFSSLIQRAAKMHRRLRGGTMTLLLVTPGLPASGERQWALSGMRMAWLRGMAAWHGWPLGKIGGAGCPGLRPRNLASADRAPLAPAVRAACHAVHAVQASRAAPGRRCRPTST